MFDPTTVADHAAAKKLRIKIEQLAQQAAEHCCGINAKPQDWLDEDFRRRSIEGAVIRVLADFLLGPQLITTMDER